MLISATEPYSFKMARAWLLVLVAVIALAAAKDTTTTEDPDITTTVSTSTTTRPTKRTTTSTTTETTTTETTTTTTTTTVAPTTTPAPAPPAEYPYNFNNTPWFVNVTAGSKNYPCIILRGAFAIRVDNSTISVPANAKQTGKCVFEKSAELTLSWRRSGDPNKTSVTFFVLRNNDTNGPAYQFNKVEVQLPTFGETLVSNDTLFQAPVEKSYKCTSESHVNLTPNGAQLLMQKLQAEAFPKPTDDLFNDFHSAEECRSDDVSAVVPVAVGASLIVLVVIVLVAYIIGRRRSRARGYQSV